MFELKLLQKGKLVAEFYDPNHKSRLAQERAAKNAKYTTMEAYHLEKQRVQDENISSEPSQPPGLLTKLRGILRHILGRN